MRRHAPSSRADLKDKTVDRATVRRAWSFARPYRTKLFLYLGVIATSAVIGVVPPLIFKQIIDEAIPNKDFGQLNLLFAAAVLVAIVTTLLNLADRWFSSSIGEGIIFDLRVALYDHVQRMPLMFFTRTQTGSLLSRLSTDVVGAQATVGTLAGVISNLLIVVTTLVAMMFLDWRVTILALLVVPAFIFLDKRLGRRLAAISRERMQADAAMSSVMSERFNVSGALLVKLFGNPRREKGAFGEKAGTVRDWGVRSAVTSRSYYGALSLIAAVGAALVYWLGGRTVINGGLEIGSLVVLAAYVQRLYGPLTSLASSRVDLLVALVAYERVFEVLDAPPSITDRPDAVELHEPLGRVDLEHVNFRYPTNTDRIASLEKVTDDEAPGVEVLHDINLTVEPGQILAIVGPSGAGKSTLASLIPRLYDVTSGALRIDGHDVRELTLQSVGDAVGVVSQDAHLFHESVAENLRFARPSATDDEVVTAAKAARIHDVIAALPDGYDTVVGERGYRLSGGEKQRVALARVLLKRPAIIVLDEATAHLDSDTEALVQEALAEALTSRTAIVIAHRLSTIRNADQIVVIEDGSIVQRGTHPELLAAGGLYRDLYETQFATAE